MTNEFKIPEPFGAIHDSHLTADMAVAPVPVRPSGWYMKPEDFTNLYTSADMRAVIEQCAELMERQHNWITNTAASALIRKLLEQVK